jgi:hypothetical protein
MITLDTDTVKRLCALRKVNEALIEGLKTAVFILEGEQEFSKERREPMIGSLKRLI